MNSPGENRSRAALLLGASGLTGGHCLHALIEDPAYGKVLAIGRRELPVSHPKLTQKIIPLDSLETSDLPPLDDVFCALGTTIRKAGSQEAFRRVDFEFPVAAARHSLKFGARRFMLVSSVGADPRSGNFYLRTKGEVEQAVRALPFHAIHIFRPGFLMGARSESRPGERAAIVAAKALQYLLAGPLRKYRPVEASTVARAMIASARSGNTGAHVYEFDEITSLARGI